MGVRVALLVLVLIGTVLAAAAVTTPAVDDAAARVASIDRSHGSVAVPVATTDHIALAVVAAEDGRFYSHHGVDALGVVRALGGRLTGTDAGGSTLDQQLAHALYVPGGNGLWAGAQEVALSLKLEGHFTKQAILDLYLNAVYYGHGYYGIAAASEGYFGVVPAQLSWGQAALLAGLLQAPSALDPTQHLAAALLRRQYVVGRLVETGALTAVQATLVAASPVALRR